MKVLENLKSGLKFVDITEGTKSNLSKNKVVSLFTGAGGLDLGLESAGFDTAVCVEIDADCRETLRFNRPKWKLSENAKGGRIAGDINHISAEEILSLGNLQKGEAALVTGGAPCQSFSNIGKRDGINSETNGTLYLEFLRIVEGVEPAAVLFENVTGITQQKHGEVISTMREKLESLGYKVSYTVLNSANYGVAQRRERFFLLAIKGNENPSFPLPTHYKDKEEWLSVVKDFDEKPNYTPKRWRSL
jgi:DNA (cytosine-5)-methyltransferase 1